MSITWGSLQRLMGSGLAGAAALVFTQSPATGQQAHGGAQGEPGLHVNPRWKECSIQLDPALTQEAWRQFTGEAGLVVYFRPLVDAAPMGAGRFEVSLVQWKTGIDDHDAAWNDTFVHPDSTHWLFEGSGLAFPGLTLRAGVTNRTDVAAYVTKNQNANYGFYGGQLQHALVGDRQSKWAASARASFVSLFGPDDVDLTVFGVDLVASRKVAVTRQASIAPYAVVTGSLTRSHEKSAVVTLADENVLGAQATLGVAAQLLAARVAVEYGVARVPSFSLKVGVGL